jgi:hypothetical protein
MKNKWFISTGDEMYNHGDGHNTKEEAITAFKEQLKTGDYEDVKKQGYFWVGQAYAYAPDHFFIVDSIIEDAMCQASDNAGDCAENYLEDVTQVQRDELEALILGWIEKNNLQPNFYGIENTEKITFNSEDL